MCTYKSGSNYSQNINNSTHLCTNTFMHTIMMLVTTNSTTLQYKKTSYQDTLACCNFGLIRLHNPCPHLQAQGWCNFWSESHHHKCSSRGQKRKTHRLLEGVRYARVCVFYEALFEFMKSLLSQLCAQPLGVHVQKRFEVF